MAISQVGTLAAVTGSTTAAGTSTKSVTTTTAGDVIALFVLAANATLTVSSVAGGGADGGGWTKQVGYLGTTSTRIEMWTARAGTPGTNTLTATWSATTSGVFFVLATGQWTAGLGASTVWALDGTATGQDNASSATCSWPSKTASAAGRLYLGYGYGSTQDLVNGATSGVVYENDSAANRVVSHVSVTGTLAPTTTFLAGASSASAAIGMLLTATTAGTTAPAGNAAGTGAALQPTVATTLTPTLIRQPYTARRRASDY